MCASFASMNVGKSRNAGEISRNYKEPFRGLGQAVLSLSALFPAARPIFLVSNFFGVADSMYQWTRFSFNDPGGS